ncbi:hypothetical protein PIB30_042525 [Stylosanthes scabra]|uniref:Alpha-galactosidase n=1 Tax=Stylosanthes scabra TaxID=79078 RepID=A0ABU6UE05_9FABA|nr:hypothetical protein [Stylosanthes scabra]
MAGISTQAYDSNTPILDTNTGEGYEEYGKKWHAKDIGIPERACKWMSNGFMAINTTSRAGKAFLRSIYHLYASWGVDFVKLDCVFGDDLDMDEINVVSQIIEELNQTIILSVSPGASATPKMAKELLQSSAVTTYRITGDDWDQWPAIVSHFDTIRDFAKAKLIGAAGFHGIKSWPDLDMLPFGWLTDPGAHKGPHRLTRLTQDEQRTQMTLWCMAKSPLMYGGDLRRLDNWTYNLITNPTLLRINSFSKNNQEFDPVTRLNNNDAAQNFSKIRSWIATDGSEGEIYVAFFNLNDEKERISAKIEELVNRVVPLRKLMRNCNATEIWSGRRRMVRVDEFLSAEILPHGCTLFTLSCYYVH